MRTHRITFPRALAAALLTLLASALFAQNVKVGYDKSVDFSAFKTYAWMKSDQAHQVPRATPVIMGAVDDELQKRGLTKVESNPDMLVTYSGGLNATSSVGATDPTYSATGGIPVPNGTVWTGSMPAPGAGQEMKGTLLVELIDTKRNQLVWGGTAKANLDTDNQSKVVDQVNKVVEAMFKKYPIPKTGEQKDK